MAYIQPVIKLFPCLLQHSFSIAVVTLISCPFYKPQNEKCNGLRMSVKGARNWSSVIQTFAARRS